MTRWGSLRRRWTLVVIALSPSIVVIIGGVGAVALQSVGLLPLVGVPRLSFDAYGEIAEVLPSSIATSLWIATASTTIAIVVGTAAAVVMTTARRTSRLLTPLSAAVVTVPHIVGAAAIGLLLADSGMLAQLFGVSATSWPPFVGGSAWAAVIVEYAWKESAFVALVVAGTLAARVAQFDETAAVLGASRLRRLRLVTLPMAAPSIGVSALIIFVYTLGSYEVSWLLGRTFPEPLSVLAVRLAGSASLDTRPAAAAATMVIVALSGVATIIVAFVHRRMPELR